MEAQTEPIEPLPSGEMVSITLIALKLARGKFNGHELRDRVILAEATKSARKMYTYSTDKLRIRSV